MYSVDELVNVYFFQREFFYQKKKKMKKEKKKETLQYPFSFVGFVIKIFLVCSIRYIILVIYRVLFLKRLKTVINGLFTKQLLIKVQSKVANKEKKKL